MRVLVQNCFNRSPFWPIIVSVLDKSILCFPGGAWFSGCAGLLMRSGGLVAIRAGSIRQFAARNDKIAIRPSLKFSTKFRRFSEWPPAQRVF
jgi:hypothetical protein